MQQFPGKVHNKSAAFSFVLHQMENDPDLRSLMMTVSGMQDVVELVCISREEYQEIDDLTHGDFDSMIKVAKKIRTKMKDNPYVKKFTVGKDKVEIELFVPSQFKKFTYKG